MNSKTLAIIAYITIIGWLVAYFNRKDNNDVLLKYHLRQALGLAIISIIFNIILTIVASIIPSLYFLGAAGWIIVVLWVLGIINAANEAQEPVPLVGKMFENKFSFIG